MTISTIKSISISPTCLTFLILDFLAKPTRIIYIYTNIIIYFFVLYKGDYRKFNK